MPFDGPKDHVDTGEFGGTGTAVSAPLDLAEPEVVAAAQGIFRGDYHPDEFERVFARSTVFAQRPDYPGVLVADLGEHGLWTLAFSTIQRLAAYSGRCRFLSTTGADLLASLPRGTGVLFDLGDAHRLPILNRLVAPEVLATIRRQMEQAFEGGGSAGKGRLRQCR